MIAKLKIALSLCASVLMLTSCPNGLKNGLKGGLTGGKPNSINIGNSSTATGLGYNQKGGFQVDKKIHRSINWAQLSLH